MGVAGTDEQGKGDRFDTATEPSAVAEGIRHGNIHAIHWFCCFLTMGPVTRRSRSVVTYNRLWNTSHRKRSHPSRKLHGLFTKNVSSLPHGFMKPLEKTLQQVQNLVIDEAGEGQRVDNFLLRVLKGVPKTRVYRMIRSGEVRVNRGRVQADTRLSLGQTIRIPPLRLPTPQEEAQGAAMARRTQADRMADRVVVVHDQNGLLVVDKPAGLAVHGGSGVELGVVEALRLARADPYLELAHRLDRETSGLLMLCTQRKTLLHLHRLLREGGLRKRYLALVVGAWRETGSQLIKTPLLKTLAPNGERWVRPDPQGQLSATRVRLLGLGRAGSEVVSLLQCEPLTGRTHQIRVHLQSRGHAILGDPKYTDPRAADAARALGLKRLFLHAWRLELSASAWGEGLSLHAPLPQMLRVVLEPAGLAEPVFED